jgi:hypothetical protein
MHTHIISVCACVCVCVSVFVFVCVCVFVCACTHIYPAASGCTLHLCGASGCGSRASSLFNSTQRVLTLFLRIRCGRANGVRALRCLFSRAQRRPTSATQSRPRARRRFPAVRATVAHSMHFPSPLMGAGPVPWYRQYHTGGYLGRYLVASEIGADRAAPQ